MNLLKLSTVLRYSNPLKGNRRAQEAFTNLFPNTDFHKVVLAAGAPPESKVDVLAPNKNILAVYSTIENPESGYSPLYDSYRTFHKIDDITPKIVLTHHRQTARGSYLGKGYERFHEQLKHIRDLGIHGIHIDSGAGDKDSGLNGFFTWPRFSFNGDLSINHIKRLSQKIQDRLKEGDRDFHNLFSIPGGPEEWREHGYDTGPLWFDPNPLSEHSKRFQEYYNKRKLKENK
jgi:hypothetical protein